MQSDVLGSDAATAGTRLFAKASAEQRDYPILIRPRPGALTAVVNGRGSTVVNISDADLPDPACAAEDASGAVCRALTVLCSAIPMRNVLARLRIGDYQGNEVTP